MKFSEWKEAAEQPDGWRLLGTQAAGKDKNAFDYLLQMAYCIRTIDDFYDKDRPVGHQDILDVFKLLFSVIPSNAFYQDNIKTLQPFVSNSWEAWERANELCTLTCTDRIYAHVYREQIIGIYELVALITQGYEKMVEVKRELEKFIFSDSWMKSLEGTNVKLEYIPYVNNIQS